jgi:hypothetical protein
MLEKSFDQTFSKVCAGRGREALVAPAGAKFPKRRFCFFLRLLAQKEGRGFPHLISQQPKGLPSAAPVR